MRSPQVEAASGLPSSVTIYEVGPRDGLQNEKTIVPAATKVEFIRRLEAAGLGTIETTSFVPARWVPQMGDAEEVLAGLGADGLGRRRPALVPNERGLDRAEELGLSAIAIFGSATETFAQKNLNRSVTEQYAMFAPVVERALADGMWVRAYVSMCFGDPWEGPVPVEQVVDTAERLMDLGCHELSLGDTIGVGTTGPRAPAARGARGPRASAPTASPCTSTTPTARRSPTRWRPCATASRSSTRRPAVSAAAPTRSRPPATSRPRTSSGRCTAPGVETGVDLEALVETSVWMAGQLGRPSPSNVVRALAGA